jgi:phospholipid transport system substrate-binding protein
MIKMALVLVTMMAVALGSASATPADAPTEELRRYTDRVLEVLKAPDLSPKQRRAMVRDLAIEAFDMDETARRALGPHWQRRTPAEREEFVKVFRELLEQTYVSRIEEYGGERVEYTSERVDGDSAVVRANIVTRTGTAVPVESRLNQKGGHWRVYDVLVENVSLVANYRSQFDRVIRTSSYEELVKRLKQRVAQLAERPGKSGSAERH